MGARTLGAIQVDTSREDRPFVMDDLQLLVTIAGQLAVATENARLLREMLAQQRLAAVGQAVAGIAHCIKNTINGLTGGAYILDVGIRKEDSEKLTKGWDMVKRNTSFMSDLVQDMLAYCRKSPLAPELTDVARLLEETLLMVQEAAAQKGVETSLETDREELLAEVDPTALKRVVLNLLTNAVEACSEGCHVKVTAALTQDDGVLLIAVADDGLGMPEDVEARLFEPFFTTRGSRGTGLGLALVKKVVEEHHGRIQVESVEGKGSTFRIFIPLRLDEEETTLLR
ncbi:MAG: sensor histidine kinase, partial [Planctomycetota bacterium]|jgi:signal transduction histidine kinase